MAEEKKHKVIKNDEGNQVPDICPKCGGEVKLFIQGEPVYLCSKCKAYYGVAPRNINEANQRKLIITERQKEEIKKKLSAQDQVNGKVNAACLDGIMVCESKSTIKPVNSDTFNYKPYIKSLLNFLKDECKMNIYPYPKIKIDREPQEGLFIRTGYYNPNEKTIVLFVQNRNWKDILRSLSHELVHYSQHMNNPKAFDDVNGDTLGREDSLDKLESEAYLLGNMNFRKWTESLHPHYPAKLNEENISRQEKFLRLQAVAQSDDLLNGFSINDFLEEEHTPQEIDLSSFNLKNRLNPKFWVDGHLDKRIRKKLLDIADDFIEYLGVDWVEPEDIIMTGSLANYNWDKKYSDIDLHIVMDFEDVYKRKDFVAQYFNSMKSAWNEAHEDLKIYGFPVELYVQDVNEKHSSSGVYSIDKDKWLTEPDKEKIANHKVNKEKIRKKVSDYMNKIDNLQDTFDSLKEKNGISEKIFDSAEKIFNDIKNERKNGFKASENEYNNGNLIFKALRRSGYIQKIYDLKEKSYNKMNSL